MDKYQEKFIKMIKEEFNSGNYEDGLCAIIDKIYENGFEDGANSNEDIAMLERENHNMAKELKRLNFTNEAINDICNN